MFCGQIYIFYKNIWLFFGLSGSKFHLTSFCISCYNFPIFQSYQVCTTTSNFLLHYVFFYMRYDNPFHAKIKTCNDLFYSDYSKVGNHRKSQSQTCLFLPFCFPCNLSPWIFLSFFQIWVYFYLIQIIKEIMTSIHKEIRFAFIGWWFFLYLTNSRETPTTGIYDIDNKTNKQTFDDL